MKCCHYLSNVIPSSSFFETNFHDRSSIRVVDGDDLGDKHVFLKTLWLVGDTDDFQYLISNTLGATISVLSDMLEFFGCSFNVS